MNKQINSIWIIWLKIASLFVSVTGLFFVITSFLETKEVAGMDALMLSPFYPDLKEISIEDLKMKSFAFGVTGAVMFSWGTMLYTITSKVLVKKKKWGWNSIFFSLIGWFVLDQLVSAYYSVTANVLGNIGFFLLFFIPLIFVRRELK